MKLLVDKIIATLKSSKYEYMNAIQLEKTVRGENYIKQLNRIKRLIKLSKLNNYCVHISIQS